MKHHGTLPDESRTAACVRTGTLDAYQAGDVIIPFAELWDGLGRYMDCKPCGEAVAQAMGGSMQRPKPPADDAS
jgi:hypothetical protein